MDALLVLLGAVVGAAGSAGGSVLVNRRELVRRARIRMYHTLVPAMIETAIGDGQHTNWDRREVEALYRESALAGRQEQALVDAVLDGWQRQAAISMQHRGNGGLGPVFPVEHLARWNGQNEVLLASLDALEAHLRSKIR